MLFNSTNFIIFLPVVFILYWFAAKKSLQHQNTLLLIASYYFYACWDWRFLFLLIFSTLLDYFTGLKMGTTDNQKSKKYWFALSLTLNIGFLGVFKYYNFFAESFAGAVSNIGLEIHPRTLDVILPVGISFYTFHGLSYVIDIYKEKIKAEKNIINYAVFVSFFPLLVAGPIERATHLLPQINNERIFIYSKAVDGLRQIIWGLFKKIVIADNCAVFADHVFANSAGSSGSTLAMGAIFFSFQIYGDFSGYSDIALGTARLFGIELLRNFAFPYFSRDIAEFWRRWHISLSSWFKDYVYVPLGGSRGGKLRTMKNIFIIFILSGFWHGADWTYLMWGLLNAIYFLPLLFADTNRNHLEIVAKGKYLPTIKETCQILITFGLTVMAWIFFRADDINHAVSYISGMMTPSICTFPRFTDIYQALTTIILIIIFMLIEWLGRDREYALANFGRTWKRPLRYGMYYAILIAILWFSVKEQKFIYFQF